MGSAYPESGIASAGTEGDAVRMRPWARFDFFLRNWSVGDALSRRTVSDVFFFLFLTVVVFLAFFFLFFFLSCLAFIFLCIIFFFSLFYLYCFVSIVSF